MIQYELNIPHMIYFHSKICQICHKRKFIQCKSINKCSNSECNVYICNKCTIQWRVEHTTCPICHTEINPSINVENNNKMKNICIIDQCCCKKLLQYMYMSIISLLILWVVGNLSYWSIIHFMVNTSDSFVNLFCTSVKHRIFHIFMIICGVITIFVVIGIYVCMSNFLQLIGCKIHVKETIVYNQI